METFEDYGTNIGYWEQALSRPTPAYKQLFEAEEKYLKENIQPERIVLDVGCGEGRNMESILTVTPFVFGIDNDPKAIEEANRRFGESDNVKVFCADANDLPFPLGTFDVVTFLMILPNLNQNKQLALNEAARVLVKDGKLILSAFAETAFEERMKVYQMINCPIKAIEGTKVIFDESLGANTSEQFSLEELKTFGENAGLQMIDHVKVADLAYICMFEKI